MRRSFLLLVLPLLTAAILGQNKRHLWVDAAAGKDTFPGTAAQPFRSVTKGVSVGTLDAVIHVRPGVYSPSKTGEVFTISFGSGFKNVSLVGTDANTCIIDFEQVVASTNAWYFLIDTGAENIEIAHLTLRNGAFRPAVPWYSSAIWWRSVKGLNLHSCFIESCESGIYSANGAQNVRVHDNVFLGNNVAVRFRQDANQGARDCRFFNNLVADCTGAFPEAMSPSGADPTQVIVNNIVVNNKAAGFQGTLPTGVVFENNLSFNNPSGDYNLGATPPKSNLNVDPLLVDLAKRNFRLQAKSPCLEAGYPVGQPEMVNDFYGNARVSDHDEDLISLVDIGVHEVPGMSLSVSNFAQGQTATFRITRRQPNVALGYLFLGIRPVSVVISPFGSLGIDLSPGVSFMVSGFSVPGQVMLPIPTNPQLNDVQVYFQGLAIGLKNSGKPSGRLDLVL